MIQREQGVAKVGGFLKIAGTYIFARERYNFSVDVIFVWCFQIKWFNSAKQMQRDYPVG
jgi:hypothetical protein